MATATILASYVEQYALEHDLADGTVQQMRNASRLFAEFAGNAELNDDAVNRWLLHRKQTGLSPATVRGNRISLLTLWRAAFDDGLVSELPRRVRLIRLPDTIPVCWTHDDLRRLLAECDRLKGKFRKLPIGRAIYCRSLVNAKYDAGLRLGDMFSIERPWIWPGGFLSIVQRKSGRGHRAQFRDSTIAEIDQCMAEQPDRRLIWPPFCDRRRFYRFFKALAGRAGLTGTSKFIRRSSASYYEREHPGEAWRHLGHASPGLDRRAYIDPRIAYPQPRLPPRIA